MNLVFHIFADGSETLNNQLSFFATDDKDKESSDTKLQTQDMEETILKRAKIFQKHRHLKKKSD